MASSPFENNRDVIDSAFLKEIGDLDGRIRSTKFDRRYMYDTFDSSPVLGYGADATGAAVTTTGTRVVASARHHYLFGAPVAQTLLGPFKGTTVGWNISMDLTEDDVVEILPSGGLATDCPCTYVVGTDGAFFMRYKLTVTDVSGSDLTMGGFRKQEAINATYTAYSDFAAIGHISGDHNIATELNGGGHSFTDTTQNLADAGSYTGAVKVSSAGVVTFEIGGAAPTATVAFTFDTGDRVVPHVHLRHDADFSEAVSITLWECGLQPSSVVTLV